MNPRLLATATSFGRVLVGAGLISSPERLTAPWVGRAGSRGGAKVLGRALGIRDLVLGAGALSSSDEQLQSWLLAALAADTTDFLATMTSEDVPLRGQILVGLAALGGAASGAAALIALNR